MTTAELFQTGSAVLSMAAIVFTAGSYFQRLRVVEREQSDLKKAFQRFLDTCRECKSGLQEEDGKLHDRVTAVTVAAARLEGELGDANHRPHTQ